MTAKRRLAITAAIASTALLGACGTGFDAQTNQPYQPGIGANVRSGDVQVYNALLVENSDGTVSFAGGLLNTTDEPMRYAEAALAPLDEPTEAAPVEAVPFDLEPDVLFSVETEGGLSGLDAAGLTAGDYGVMTIEFDTGATLSVEAPVVERTAMYREVPASAPDSGGDEDTDGPFPEGDAADTEDDPDVAEANPPEGPSDG